MVRGNDVVGIFWRTGDPHLASWVEDAWDDE